MTTLVSPAIFNVDMAAISVMARYLEKTFNLSGFSSTGIIAMMSEEAVELRDRLCISTPEDLTAVLHNAVDMLTDDQVADLLRQHRAMCLEQGLDINQLEKPVR